MTEAVEAETASRKSALLKKISGLRADVIAQEWKDDKMVPVGKGYGYVSADKVNRTLAPLFNRNGLEFRSDFDQLTLHPISGNGYHWTVRFTATIVDTDTGESESYTAYGEGEDALDKGINKAQTNAFKQWFFKTFCIADGIDPEQVESTGSSFRSRSKEEEEIKSRAFANAVNVPKPASAPSAPVTAPKPAAPAPAPSKVVPKPQAPKAPAPAPAPKAAEVPKAEPEAPKAEVASEAAPAPKRSTPITLADLRSIEHLIDEVHIAVENGTRDVSDYDSILAERKKLQTSQEAYAFIKKWGDVI